MTVLEVDDDFEPPVPVELEDHPAMVTCPACSEPLKKHSSLQLLRCADKVEAPCPACGAQSGHVDGCEEAKGEGEFAAWMAGRPRPVPETPPAVTDIHALIAAVREAADEGATDEQLKWRLAKALEEAQMWRGKAQAASALVNQLQAKVAELTKAKRQAKQKRVVDRPKVAELPVLLDACRKTPGVEVRKQGNGHWGIYKDDAFVTSTSATPSDHRSNMNFRAKLRQAGIAV